MTLLVGSTAIVQEKVSGAVAFTLPAGSCSVRVTKPDGSVLTPAVTITPGTPASLAHTLSTPVAFDQGGAYPVDWAAAQGGDSAQAMQFLTKYFAYWSDAPKIARLALHTTTAVLTDDLFDLAFDSARRRIYGMCTALTPYSALLGDQRGDMDEGLALLAALRVKSSIPVTLATGAVTHYKAGPVEYQYADTTKQVGGRAFSLEDQLFEQAMQALCRIDTFHAVYVGILKRRILALPTRGDISAVGEVGT